MISAYPEPDRAQGEELMTALTDSVSEGVPAALTELSELGEHDENVSFDQVAATIGRPDAELLRSLTLEVYARAEQIARSRGIVLADTTLEFGRDASGAVVLGDEVLTSDSSRFWPDELWEPGGAQPSFDKQVLRDWLTSPAAGWDRAADVPPPPLPDESSS